MVPDKICWNLNMSITMCTLGRNALPIYDSIMANTVMRKPAVEGKHLAEFWRVMHKKSLQLNIDLMPLERQIFKYGFSQK